MGALEGSGFEWKMAAGNHIFVHPWQATGGLALKGSHVIVAESLEYLVDESIAESLESLEVESRGNKRERTKAGMRGAWSKERLHLKLELANVRLQDPPRLQHKLCSRA